MACIKGSGGGIKPRPLPRMQLLYIGLYQVSYGTPHLDSSFYFRIYPSVCLRFIHPLWSQLLHLMFTSQQFSPLLSPLLSPLCLPPPSLCWTHPPNLSFSQLFEDSSFFSYNVKGNFLIKSHKLYFHLSLKKIVRDIYFANSVYVFIVQWAEEIARTLETG